MSPAVLSTIAIAILERPEFDNTHLGNSGRWALDNCASLARYWSAQGNVLDLSKQGEEDFDVWLLVQHDLELRRRDRARLPHGETL